MTTPKSASMSEWAKVSLSEVATITPGFAFKSKEFLQHGTPVVKIKDINPPLVKSSDLARIDEDSYPLGKLDKYRLRSGDFVVAMTGATIGKVGRYVSKERGLLNQRVAKISPIHSVSWDFIYHAVSMPYFERFIENNIDSESAQANISASGIGRYPIALPKLKEQEAIAEVLSSLDDKIDLLKRQNKTLEGIAEALFRQWFIEEAQDDWPEVEIGDVYTIERGLSYKGAGLTSFNDPSGVAMFNLNSVLEFGGYKEEGIKFYNGPFKERHEVCPGDVLVANTEQGHDHRLIGFPCIVPAKFKRGILTHHLYKLTPKAELGGHFVHQLLKTFAVRGQVEGCTNGSTVNMLLIDLFGRVSFKLPPELIHDVFENQVSMMHMRKEQNMATIEVLEKKRDTLLPKLMSGEVRVKLD